jgi:hypothetical protein
MTAGWVAGCVRAKSLARRRLGTDTARQVAACGSLSDAQRALGATAYGRRVRPGQELAAAQHEITESLLWDLRVLAGWLPRDGVRVLRVLAAWFELANVEELLAAISGRPAEAEFQLGALATAWPRLRQADSEAALRAILAASDWRDPGGGTEHAVRLGMRARYAARAATLGDPVRSWATGAMALLVAGEVCAGETATTGRGVPPVLANTVLSDARGLLRLPALGAVSLDELAARLPPNARWALNGVSAPESLWRAEAAWWARIERDGLQLLHGGLDRQLVIGAVAVMACDAWRVRAALELAARGGVPLDVYDKLAGHAQA